MLFGTGADVSDKDRWGRVNWEAGIHTPSTYGTNMAENCGGRFFGVPEPKYKQTSGNGIGHTPQWLGFSGRSSGKTSETLSELFLESPSRVQLGTPKARNARQLKPPEHFQNSLPLRKTGDACFFSEVVPEKASQSWSWSSKITDRYL